ncbi:hypothetical protein MRX96_047021 [Rhipicephalus microplus]
MDGASDSLRGGSQPRFTTATGCEPRRHKERRPATSTKEAGLKRRRSQPPAEQGTEAVRPQATRTQTRKSATSSKSATSRSSQSNEEEDEYIELVLSRLLRAAGDLGLNVPAKEEEPRCAAHKFIYSAATPRSLNVHSRASTPASRLEHRD